jgi:hypothetical protein
LRAVFLSPSSSGTHLDGPNRKSESVSGPTCRFNLKMETESSLEDAMFLNKRQADEYVQNCDSYMFNTVLSSVNLTQTYCMENV